MNIISVLVVLIIIGVVLYLVERFIPMDATIKLIVRIVVLLVVILWLLRIFGLLSSTALHIP